jgi:small neutral amino acid transporter SnatA (MarC family)
VFICGFIIEARAMTILSAVVMLLLVMDPVGNAVNAVVLLKGVPPARRTAVVVRESLIALGILLAFLWGGRYLLEVLRIREPILTVAGGVVLFLIAIRMIFTPKDGIFGAGPEGEPFVVPLATPFLAGPSAMAVVLLLASSNPDRLWDWTAAIGIVWAVIVTALLVGGWLARVLGDRGATAVQKLMGMILTAVAIQLLFSGMEIYLKMRGS